MALVMAVDGKQDALAYAINALAPENLVLRLFVNDIEPAAADTEADYDEVTDGGYVPALLDGPDWDYPTDADPSVAVYPTQTFTFEGAVPAIYGYFYTRETSGRLFAAERFDDGPYVVPAEGGVLRVTPRLTAD
jgi:hypothetical protein